MNEIYAWTQEQNVMFEYKQQGFSTTFVDYIGIDNVRDSILYLDNYIEMSRNSRETVVMMIELSHIDKYMDESSLSNLDSTGVNPPKLYFESKDSSLPGNIQVLQAKEAIYVPNPYPFPAENLDFFYYCTEDIMDKGIWYRLLFVTGKGLVSKD